MGKLSENDKDQLEYICKWKEMREEREKGNEHRKRMKKFHLLRAKWYLKNAFEALKMCLFVEKR